MTSAVRKGVRGRAGTSQGIEARQGASATCRDRRYVGRTQRHSRARASRGPTKAGDVEVDGVASAPTTLSRRDRPARRPVAAPGRRDSHVRVAQQHRPTRVGRWHRRASCAGRRRTRPRQRPGPPPAALPDRTVASTTGARRWSGGRRTLAGRLPWRRSRHSRAAPHSRPRHQQAACGCPRSAAPRRSRVAGDDRGRVELPGHRRRGGLGPLPQPRSRRRRGAARRSPPRCPLVPYPPAERCPPPHSRLPCHGSARP